MGSEGSGMGRPRRGEAVVKLARTATRRVWACILTNWWFLREECAFKVCVQRRYIEYWRSADGNCLDILPSYIDGPLM
jgi:hypothetical protein